MSKPDDQPNWNDVARELDARVGRRLTEVERSNQSLRRTVLLMGIAMAVMVAGGITFFVAAPDITVSASTVETNQLILRDTDGHLRGSWGTGEDGASRLVMRDRDGRERMRMTVIRDGSPGLSFTDREGRTRAVLGLLPDETSTLVFADEQGRSRTVLGVSPDQSSTLVFVDELGETRIGLGIDMNGAAGLTVYDYDGEQEEVGADPVSGGGGGEGG